MPLENLPDPQAGQVVSASLLRAMLHALQSVVNLDAEPPLEITQGPGGRSISLHLPQEWLWIRVTGNTQDGTNKRWKYDWEQVEKTSAGYGGWTAVSGGHTGHSSSWGYAYNTIENINGATGTWGNGVASTNLTGSLTIKPVPNSVPLRAWIVYPLSSGALPELWFSYENGIDGGCT